MNRILYLLSAFYASACADSPDSILQTSARAVANCDIAAPHFRVPSTGQSVLDDNLRGWFLHQFDTLLQSNELADTRGQAQRDARLAQQIARYFPLRIRPTPNNAHWVPQGQVDCWTTTVMDAVTGDYYTAELFGDPIYSQTAGNAFCEQFSPRHPSELAAHERCMFVTSRQGIECNALYLWDDDALTMPPARALPHDAVQSWFRSWIGSVHRSDYSGREVAAFSGTHFLNSHPHVRMGVPMRYNGEPKIRGHELLVVKPEFVVLHDARRKIASWVAYHLKATHLGGQPRISQARFYRDPDFPSLWPQATDQDYKGLNGDMHRGHLCRSSDRSGWGVPDGLDVSDRFTSSHQWGHREQTDVWTNVAPQFGNFNSGPWRQFEDFLQQEVVQKHGKEAYVTVITHHESHRNLPAIGSEVAVPRTLYKIAVIVDPNQGASSVSRATHVIAVRMANTQNYPKVYHYTPTGVVALEQWKGYWTKFIVPVHTIEHETGWRFFDNIVNATGDESLADELRDREHDVIHYWTVSP